MILIIVPTYNERENISLLAEKIFSLHVSNVHLLVVDDNSPDGTAAVAENLANRYPIAVLKRQKKEGLGPAYIAGFNKSRKVNIDPEPSS